MLTIYRRHRKDCDHRSDGRKYRRCRCPIWVDGFLAGQEIRKSLDLADWQKAHDVLSKMEATDSQPNATDEPVTIAQGWEKFLEDAKARKLTEPSIYKYELLSRQMKSFAEKYGYRFLSELTVDVLSTFRAEWKDGALSSVKKLERLRTFLGFALERKWIAENPALKLKAPKVQLRPTLPFIHQEMVSILTAIETYRRDRAIMEKQRAPDALACASAPLQRNENRGCGKHHTGQDQWQPSVPLHGQNRHASPYDTARFCREGSDATPRMTEKHYF